MRTLLLSICLPLGFGCSQLASPIDEQNQTPLQPNAERIVAAPNTQTNGFQTKAAVYNSQDSVIEPEQKNINDYTHDIMQQIFSNLQYVNDQTPIAVSSFIYLNDDYNKSTLLGNQLAENFMHELHIAGFPVIDFKTTNFMRVTQSGDFVFSRNYLELTEDQNFNYVLAGTLVSQNNGVLVNARIIGLTSKTVVGSAQGFIPKAVVNSIDTNGDNESIILNNN